VTRFPGEPVAQTQDQTDSGDGSAMRNVFAWLLIVLGLMLAVGGAGMIVIGFLTNSTVSLPFEVVPQWWQYVTFAVMKEPCLLVAS
jgi:hypothetical protein